MNLKYDISYLSTKEAAERWAIKPTTVAKYCRENKIPKAFKDKTTKQWKIPADSIKPLTKTELNQVLIYILKMINYSKIDLTIIDEFEQKETILSTLNYLEVFGYIYFFDNIRDFHNIIITDKGYEQLKERSSGLIKIEVDSVLDVLKSIIEIVKTLI